MKKITRSHDVDEHRARLFDRWKGAFEAGAEGENTKGLFKAPLEHQTLRWTTWLERDAVWERYSTLSQISTQEPGEYEVRRHSDMLWSNRLMESSRKRRE